MLLYLPNQLTNKRNEQYFLHRSGSLRRYPDRNSQLREEPRKGGGTPNSPSPHFMTVFAPLSVCYDVSVCELLLLLLRLAKFDSDKTKIQGFRENLKSTGQSKFTLEEREETAVG